MLAAISDDGAILNINVSAGETLQINPTSSGYLFTSNQVFDDVGVADPNDFSGFDTLSLQLLDLAQYYVVRITDSGAGAAVTFGGSATHTFRDQFQVTLDNSPVDQGVKFVGINDFGDLGLRVTTDTGILVDFGAEIRTNNGDVRLIANPNRNTARPFDGIVVDGTIETRGTGDILLVGTGGGNVPYQSELSAHGIIFKDGSRVASTSQSAFGGSVSLFGTGNTGRRRTNVGMIIGGDVEIQSAYGDIDIRANAPEWAFENIFQTEILSTISSTGTGLDAANISIKANASEFSTYLNDDLEISTVDGDISIEAAGESYLRIPITSTGVGPDAGNISIHMTRPRLDTLTSVDGDISVTSDLNIEMIGNIVTTGTTPDSGNVYLRASGQVSVLDVLTNQGNITLEAIPTDKAYGGSVVFQKLETIGGDIFINADGNLDDLTVVASHRVATTQILSQSGNITIHARGSSIDRDLFILASSVIGGPNATGDIEIRADSIVNRATDPFQTSGQVSVSRFNPARVTLEPTVSAETVTVIAEEIFVPQFTNITAPLTRLKGNIQSTEDFLDLAFIGDLFLATGSKLNIESPAYNPGLWVEGSLSLQPGGVDLTVVGDVSDPPGIYVTEDFNGASGSVFNLTVTEVQRTMPLIQVEGDFNIAFSNITLNLSTDNLVPEAGAEYLLVGRGGGRGGFAGYGSNYYNDIPSDKLLPNWLGSGRTAVFTYRGGDGNDISIKVLPTQDDVVVFNNSVDSWWTLKSGYELTTDVWADGDWDAIAGDFNGDGRMDRAARQRNTGQWWVQTDQIDGSETQWVRWANDADAGWRNIQVGDVNGDGLDDIIAQMQTGHWWAAVSTGTSFRNQYLVR
ncbi:MAG: VCBS repeat-containing protein, partial [Planctomycetaceae bacterium]|nr:VCBS repeat-containing protein [Planctomycetaceae bacterium]